MEKTTYLHFFFFILFLGLPLGVYSVAATHGTDETADSNHSLVPIGLVLDLNSHVGVMAEVSTAMAVSDFYSVHPNYRTRLSLHAKHSEDVVGTASAAVELLKNEEVQAIIGLQRSTEVAFIIELGEKAHVPIISFSARSSSLSPSQSPYFIRTATDESSQVKAITAIVLGFGWHEVVFLYESEYGNDFIPYLTKAFQEANIRLPCMSAISASAKDHQILKEVNKFMTLQTTVFLVHMTPVLGSRLFVLANKAGMISEGNAWITTDLSDLLSLDGSVLKSMEGVLGVRPYVPESEDLEKFKMRWKRNMAFLKPNAEIIELNNFGLWAYDTVWALAMAIERIGPLNSSLIKGKNNKNESDITNVGVSEIGPRLLNEIIRTRFKGMSGEFHLVNGQLQPSAFEIFNIIGKGERVVGYWTPEGGISQELGSTSKFTHSTSMNELKKIIWPGDSVVKPIGWAVPSLGKKLRVGVPFKKGFIEFVNVQENPDTNHTNVTGFCIDVFEHALKCLPFKIDPVYTSFSDANYTDLLLLILNKTVDAVVGDVTIRSQRASIVDFTLPYSESGVVMVVRAKQNKLKNMWIFLKPLTWDLWLTIGLACIITGAVVRILESHANPQQHVGMLFWFPLSVLAFPERNLVANKWSRFVLVTWLFVTFILMQSYTASLSSMLTVNELLPSLPNEFNVGYSGGSFVKDLLVNQLNIKPEKLKNYSTIEEYDKALSHGSSNGGIDAIFDEIPYVKLFLHRYGSKYMVVGPTYKADGFGFAFPLGSRLVPYISRAILNVTESQTMNDIEKRNFGPGYNSRDVLVPVSTRSQSLSGYSFAGLFITTGFATLFALVCSEISFWQRFISRVHHYSQRPSDRIDTTVNSMVEMNTQAVPAIDNQENSYPIDENISIENEGETERDNNPDE